MHSVCISIDLHRCCMGAQWFGIGVCGSGNICMDPGWIVYVLQTIDYGLICKQFRMELHGCAVDLTPFWYRLGSNRNHNTSMNVISLFK